MVKRHQGTSHSGFSLVEMLVALVFTMILMAGMATVFKTSLASFYTSGEILSSARRNRMSIDLLGDDLNSAGMYLADLSIPPSIVPSAPPFYILPNEAIAGAGATDPQQTDELYFYMDQPAAFEGTLKGAAPAQTASELVLAGVAAEDSDFTYTIECHLDAYAKAVKQGQIFVFKDSWETAYVRETPTVNGTEVTVIAGPAPNAQITGSGATGMPSKAKHIPTSGVLFIQPAQVVRYRIELVQLDPAVPAGIPCLVRDQGTYNPAGFAATEAQQIITENVSGFKIYLSADSGQSWAGLGKTYSTFADGWDGGIRTEVDTQLASAGRPDFKTTRVNEHWFRSIPTLVRVDVSTRTATQRTEYSNTPNTAAFKNLTQSLVFVPRHFGLTMN